MIKKNIYTQVSNIQTLYFALIREVESKLVVIILNASILC